MTLKWTRILSQKEAFGTLEFQLDSALECVQKRLKFGF